MRIAAKIVVREHKVIHRIAVVVAEPVAPVVAAAAVLGQAGFRLNLASLRLDAEIAAAQVHDFPRLQRLDDTSALAVGSIDPAVEAPGQAVDTMLLIALGE